jgi:hypothetical protein
MQPFICHEETAALIRSSDNCKRLLRCIGGVAVAILGILSALGSGGGNNNDNPAAPAGAAPAGIAAYNFDEINSGRAAQLAASVLSFFPNFTATDRLILTMLAASDPGNSPFDLAMCANTGRSMLTWIDSDHSGELSVGDSASLQLTNCDTDGNGTSASGTVKFGVTSLDTDPLPNSIGFNASVNLTVTDAADNTHFVANFRATSSTPNNTDFTDIYTANDASDQKLTVTENGGALFEFGCFNVTQTFTVATGAGSYDLSPSGVINAADSIMSLAGGSRLSFIDDALESGRQRLLSSPSPNCATVGVPDGIGGSDGSYLDIEALGGGNVRLHTFDAANAELNTLDTTWSALLN